MSDYGLRYFDDYLPGIDVERLWIELFSERDDLIFAYAEASADVARPGQVVVEVLQAVIGHYRSIPVSADIPDQHHR